MIFPVLDAFEIACYGKDDHYGREVTLGCKMTGTIHIQKWKPPQSKICICY